MKHFANRKDELPEGVSSYTYLHGCREDIREAVKMGDISEIKDVNEFIEAINVQLAKLPEKRILSISESAFIKNNWGNGEKADKSILGLQDKFFGVKANQDFTKEIERISELQKPEIMPEHVADPPTEKIQSLLIESIDLTPSEKLAAELYGLFAGSNKMKTPEKVGKMMELFKGNIINKVDTML